MIEVHQRAQKQFGVHRHRSQSPTLEEHSVTGLQLIPNPSPEPKQKSDETKNASAKRSQDRSANLQDRLYKKYKNDIENVGKNLGRSSETKMYREIVVDGPGIVGYVDGLKSRGIIKRSFTTPT